jgi:transmembrane sensor
MIFRSAQFRRYSDADLAAAAWLVRRDSGFTPEEKAEFERWLAADPRHEKAFATLDSTWEALEEVRSLSRFGEQPDPETLAPARVGQLLHRTRSSSRGTWRRIAAAAAAATVVLALVGTWRLNPDGDYRRTMSTDVGGIQKLDLPDGSIAHLNTDTALTVQYSSGERRIHLHRGEAHFTVAREAERPFNVLANDVRVCALGTAFNVRLQTGAIEVTVTAGQVRVSAPDLARDPGGALPSEHAESGNLVEKPGRSTWASTAVARGERAGPQAPAEARWSDLAAGQRVLISVAAIPPLAAARESAEKHPASEILPVNVPDDELQRALAWQNRRLEFAAVPLRQIAAEFNRYNRHKLVIADASLAERCFGGTFAAQGYETLVHLLKENHGVVVERRENETVLKLDQD